MGRGRQSLVGERWPRADLFDRTMKETSFTKELLFSRKTIRERVKALAQQISDDHLGKAPILIGVLNGVIFFFADLMREITIPTQMDFVRVKSYGSGMTSSGQAVLTKDVEISVEGKPIVLVEDIVDTGLTLAHISDILKEKGPESVKTCTLIDKLERRSEAVHIDYSGFRIREGFVVGYGLDYNEDYRYLPDIYVLRLPGGSS